MKSQAWNKDESPLLFSNYLKEIKRYSLLSRTEERELISKAQQGDIKARNRLVCANLRLVIKVALIYKYQGLPLMDLINEGNMGIIMAIHKFRLSKKVRFTSYAIWWIRQAIIKALFDKARTVRLSAANELLIRRLAKAAGRNWRRLWSEQSKDLERLAEKMGIPVSTIERLAIMDQQALSLNAPLSMGSGGATNYDMIEDLAIVSPADTLQKNELVQFIQKSLQTLKPSERKIIILAFGLNSNAVLNLHQMGDLLGISKERVRQLKNSALNKLKKNIQHREYLKAA